MAPTPSSKTNHGHSTLFRTPQSKHRLQFNNTKSTHPSPNPNSVAKETPPAEHPVEVIGRIRDYTDRKEKSISNLQVIPDKNALRVRADFGYRDFSLDGISFSEQEDLDAFYKKFVESRINGVKLGAKCTIMMYGPTGSGKSHTMFGCGKQPGIVYRSLKDILGENGDENGRDGERVGVGTFVHVTVLEIYNEEIYDLLSSNGGGGFGLGWSKGNAAKVRLEVMGGKAKNATFISGTEAGKISKEIQKVEKRRIVKSTHCNERSSRSHCMVILDVPTVGGRLMLVDMAGSENIEQAGQSGFEAKMQTAKINQGNIALKRVVESIANGDSHVPFRDSKLTMLLQDSFEDDKSKILMILCASPDPKEIHKTISTLEYGAKAKCIVRGPHTPVKDKCNEDSSSAVILGSRIAAMDQFIYKLQMENKTREKERNEAHKQLMKKEEEVSALRAKLDQIEGKGAGISEEELNLKVNERTRILKQELDKKLEECQRMANEFVEMERRRMEEQISRQQEEVEMLRKRLEELESELYHSSNGNRNDKGLRSSDGSSFARRLLGIYVGEDPMVKSMDLDMGDPEPYVHDVKYVDGTPSFLNQSLLNTSTQVTQQQIFTPQFGDRVCLSTVYEEDEKEEEEQRENPGDAEVEKEIIEEKRVCSNGTDEFGIVNTSSLKTSPQNYKPASDVWSRNLEKENYSESANVKDATASRRLRIQNIFTLCGNQRELSQHIGAPVSAMNCTENTYPDSSPVTKEVPVMNTSTKKIFSPPAAEYRHDHEILVDKNESDDNKITDTQVNRNVFDEISLASKENYNPTDKSADSLRDPARATEKLPLCNDQLHGHLACVPSVKTIQSSQVLPFSPLENKLPFTPTEATR